MKWFISGEIDVFLQFCPGGPGSDQRQRGCFLPGPSHKAVPCDWTHDPLFLRNSRISIHPRTQNPLFSEMRAVLSIIGLNNVPPVRYRRKWTAYSQNKGSYVRYPPSYGRNRRSHSSQPPATEHPATLLPQPPSPSHSSPQPPSPQPHRPSWLRRSGAHRRSPAVFCRAIVSSR